MTIEEIKSIPITTIAGQLGIEIDGSGKAYCFNGHDKATPSLSFNRKENYFHCFGCGIGGSSIDLVRAYYGKTTAEAIRWIEGEGSTWEPVPRILPPRKTKRTPADYTRVYQRLLEQGEAGPARDYLQQRGIDPVITDRAGIRMITRDPLPTLREEFSTDELAGSGIIATGKKTGREYYALFAHALVIPYYSRDTQSILSVQGRAIDSQTEPKYRQLGARGTVLYNLSALDRGNTLYICEGAIDALSCYQMGLEHPLGVPGVNNFKDEYYDLLQDYKIIIAGDNDPAGRAFYLRLKREYLKRGKRIYRLDYQRLKAETGQPDVHDLNDIVRGLYG